MDIYPKIDLTSTRKQKCFSTWFPDMNLKHLFTVVPQSRYLTWSNYSVAVVFFLMYVCVCVCTWRAQDSVQCHSQECYLPLLRQSLSLV